MNANPTMKEIANKAGVSLSVAAAILRDKKCSIRYSEKTSQKVKQVAEKLGYHPNRLAQAMVSGKVPLVVVSLHLENVNFDETNYYLNDNLLTASMTLHQAGFEMIFLPYANHDEQLVRLRNLVDGKLVSGVITNFIANKNDMLIQYLKSRNTPFVILGDIPDTSICKVIRDESIIIDTIAEFAKESGCRRIIQIGKSLSDKKLIYNEKKLSGSLNIAIEETDFEFNDPEILFIADNDSLGKVIEEKGLDPAKFVVVDDLRRMVTFRPAILIHKETSNAAIAVEMLLKWINSDIPPENKSTTISLKAEDIEILR